MSTLLRAARSLFTPYAFHKTHKTGGTTLQNILLRLALKERLNVVIPPKGRHDFTVVNPETQPRNVPLNMHCAHSTWNYTTIRSVDSSVVCL